MSESITIKFAGRADGGQDVNIKYHPETSEYALRDEMLAWELALHTLALHAISLRQRIGMSVPDALYIIAQAHTFQELM